MFEASLGKFVKSVGKESLISVPSLDEADRCQPYQIVIKKNRRWFWQSPKYEPMPFKLYELLTDQETFDNEVEKKERTLATTYKRTYKFDVNGKIGTKLKALWDIELSGEDDINIEASFGEIKKDELDQPALMKAIEKRSLDLNHEFLKQVRESTRKVFCIITGVAKLAEDGEINMTITTKGEEKMDADIGDIPILDKEKIVDTEEEGSITDETERTLGIPKDTPLAYNICELYVKKTGALELIIAKDAHGGFESSREQADGETEEVEGSKAWQKKISLEEQFMPLLELSVPDRLPLTVYILDICGSPQDIPVVLQVLKEAVISSKDPKYKHLMHKVRQINPIKAILRNVGFDVRDSNLALTYPKEISPLLITMLAVFQALDEMDDDETLALHECNGNYAKDLLYLLNGALLERKLNISDPELSILYSEPNPGQAFAQTLGFQVGSGGKIYAGDDNTSELEGAYRAVFALWYKIHETPEEKLHKFHCAIL